MNAAEIQKQAEDVLHDAEDIASPTNMTATQALMFWRLIESQASTFVRGLTEEVNRPMLDAARRTWTKPNGDSRPPNHGEVIIQFHSNTGPVGRVFCGYCQAWIIRDGATMPDVMDDVLDAHVMSMHRED